MFPTRSTATPRGLENVASEGGPPSPRAWLAPESVLISPVVTSTKRTLPSLWSAIYMFPALSKPTPVGLLRTATDAGNPSPTPVLGVAPPPATVVTILQPAGGVVRTPLTVVEQLATVHFRILLLRLSAMYKLAPVASIARPLGPFNCAKAASTLSVAPAVPKPTTVLIIPVLRTTFRIRLAPVSAIYKLPL